MWIRGRVEGDGRQRRSVDMCVNVLLFTKIFLSWCMSSTTDRYHYRLLYYNCKFYFSLSNCV
jgi:hypothetical protein